MQKLIAANITRTSTSRALCKLEKSINNVRTSIYLVSIVIVYASSIMLTLESHLLCLGAFWQKRSDFWRVVVISNANNVM